MGTMYQRIWLSFIVYYKVLHIDNVDINPKCRIQSKIGQSLLVETNDKRSSTQVPIVQSWKEIITVQRWTFDQSLEPEITTNFQHSRIVTELDGTVHNEFQSSSSSRPSVSEPDRNSL